MSARRTQHWQAEGKAQSVLETRTSEQHVRPNVFTWSPSAYKERQEVKDRRKAAQAHYKQAKVYKLTAVPAELALQASGGNPSEAEALLQLAVAAWPDNPRHLLALAQCIAHNCKEPERALTWFDQLIEVADSPQHRAARCRALAALGWLQEALKDIEAAVAADKQVSLVISITSIITVVVVVIITISIIILVATLSISIMVWPPWAPSKAQHPVAAAKQLGGRDRGSWEQQLHQNGRHLKLRGIFLLRLGRAAEARQDFDSAVPLLAAAGLPTADCVFNRGVCQQLLGHSAAALRDIEAALLSCPQLVAGRTLLGCMYIARQRYKEALPLLQVAMAFRPLSAAAAVNVALAQYLLATSPNRTAAGAAPPPTRASRPASKAAHKVAAPAALTAGAEGEEALSDPEDDEGASCPAAGPQGSGVNQDPQQWALDVLHRSAGDGADPSQRLLLASSLENFNTAARLFEDPAARRVAQAITDADTHFVRAGEAAEVDDGFVVLLSDQVRVPGTPLVHDRELEPGEVQFNRGVLQLALGELEAAEEDFQAAVRMNPRHAHYPHYRAVAHGRKDELVEAVQWNQAALSLNPVYGPALYHLGLCLALQPRLAAPASTITSITLRPAAPVSGYSAFTLGSASWGIALAPCPSPLPKPPATARLCGWLRQGRHAEALQRLDLAARQAPRDWTVQEARGRLLQDLDRHGDALAALNAALALLSEEEGQGGPGQPAATRARLHYAMAQSAVATHSPELLRSALRAARLHGQDAASVFCLRGLLAHKEKLLGKALHYLSRAVRLAPLEPAFLFYRSQVLVERLEWSAAITDLSGALALMPHCASLYFSRGMAHCSVKDDHAARQDFEAAARLIGGDAVHQLSRRPTLKGSAPASPLASRRVSPSRLISQLDMTSLTDAKPTLVQPGTAVPDPLSWALANALEPQAATRRAVSPATSRLPGSIDAAAQRAAAGVSRSMIRRGAAGLRGDEPGVLKPDPRLWQGTKFMSQASHPPDLTPALWYHLGCCRARLLDWSGAAAAYEAAATCLPAHPAVAHELAKAYQALGEPRAALAQYSRVLALQPGNARALLRRGLCHYALRQEQEAARDLEAAKALDPADPSLILDYRRLREVDVVLLSKPGHEAMVWDLAALQQ
ncbi:hypothetical protein QJQ45_028667 [Haematococcus lacustris]|nr:hypothetical protein QJQ45_028667 [Haematococcus lacustris]